MKETRIINIGGSNGLNIAFILNQSIKESEHPSLPKGTNAYFIVDSDTDAEVIVNSIKEIVNTKGIIDIDLNDCKSILGNGAHAYFIKASGAGTSYLTDALSKIEQNAKIQGINLFNYKKTLISITINNEDALKGSFTSQLETLNDFIDKFDDGFDLKWGLYTSSSLSSNEAIVKLVTC